MTESAVVYTRKDGAEAGADLANQIRAQLGDTSPDAVIVFASPLNDYKALLTALAEKCRAPAMVGCSSAGEFSDDAAGVGMATAIALRAPEMKFTASLGRGISENSEGAVHELLAGFTGVAGSKYRHRAALVLIDALAGYAEEIVDQMTTATAGTYRFFGGGAGDDARFEHTHVFFGTEVYSNAAVALEILSDKPLGIGARHGWKPASGPMRVTESDANSVISLNVAPAAEAFAEHAKATDQQFDRADPVPFFMHNVVGIKTPTGHKLRVPLGISPQGAVVCAAEIPTGATTHIMSTGGQSSIDAAAHATRDAMQQVTGSGHKPQVALFFDCVATRLRMGNAFDDELAIVGKELHGAQFAGFNSYGQIVRSEGQFSGFHNCTAVVCVFPE